LRLVLILLAILAGVIVLLWLGLQVRLKAFTPFPQPSQLLETVPLPAGLPTPVDRFYRAVYGDSVPVIKTVVIKGLATLSPS
jgi:hypothetical protein